ncbi:DUF3082 domain-containing protein [Gloeocapsa sp. PCC 73106]|uniref:DUF3082 domain-containing protein n=1 Tax=Gloeocapsa sp. PCC 73106 TaxID=102232 RepID=UPI0002AC6B78|nr:DUF3082 domain-containing protein [Gloeocapsa sp. PCC 73106]ELR99278.1 Protein of unknown function (DUF3082) [Gloeocapsa sp. PCC 73106]
MNQKVTPIQCLVGASVSGPLAIAIFYLMRAIATTFATKPITFTNPVSIQLAIAVRTLVVGVTALGTGVFSMVTIGLILLALQLIIQKFTLKQP